MSLFGDVLGFVGGILDNKSARDATKANMNWQKQVYQNQLQWHAEDAKKAGLHPLAAIGNISSPSNISSGPTTDFSSALGKLGDGIGDAFAAYKSKDEMAAEKAIAELRDAATFNAQQREAEARSRLLNAQALVAEKQALSQSYTRPMASGREVIPGQVEADNPKRPPKFQEFENPDGSPGGRVPSDPYQQVHDDKVLLEYKPWLEAWYWDFKDDVRDLLNSLPQKQLDDLLESFSQISTRPW